MKKVVFRGQKFTIVREIVRRGTSIKTAEYCARGSSVIVLALPKKGQVLLLREKRRERGGYVWGLVAGHVEKEEEYKPILAAHRELHEETGMYAKKLKLFFISQPSSSIQWKRYVYIAEGLTASKIGGKRDADERIEVHSVPFPVALKKALRGDIKNETAALALIRYATKKRLF